MVEDPVERPDNAARAVGIRGLSLIASAFNDTHPKFIFLENSDRNDLLAMLCTPVVCSKLGEIVIANFYTSTSQRTHQHARPMGCVGAKVSDNQRHVTRESEDLQEAVWSIILHMCTLILQGSKHRDREPKVLQESRSVHNPQCTLILQGAKCRDGEPKDLHETFPYGNTLFVRMLYGR